MQRTTSKLLVIILALMMLPLTGLPAALASGPSEMGPMGGPGPFSEPSEWYDPLDDLGHVYVPPGGLVGVEVAGGDAHLLPGYNEGWLASEVITCPEGYKYDLVYIEADTPGASYIRLTILDALKDPTEVGYANETVPNHVKVTGPDHSVYDISPATFTSLRIQVNLYASGTDMPRLLSWRLYYIAMEEWHDDFLGLAKMVDQKGINVTGSEVTANLSRKSSGGGEASYEAYPPVFFSKYGSPAANFNAFYPNAGHTGYNDNVDVTSSGSYGFAFGDLDGDGYLDMVIAKVGSDSEIWWGSSSGTWSATGAKALKATYASQPAVGDVNGDGWLDVVITGTATGGGSDTYIYLNKGDGTYDATGNPSVTFTGVGGYGLDTGDLNNDGYDDIVLAIWGGSTCQVFFGGSSGPDTTADISLPATSYTYDAIARDLDGDGYLDVALAASISGSAPVYMGGANGPDTTADYTLSVGTYCMDVDAGDINGDGYMDLLFANYGSALPVYEGDSAGWSSSRHHDLDLGGGNNYALKFAVVDADLDGYDDILAGAYTGGTSYSFVVFKGGTTWPTTAAITKSGLYYPRGIGVAVPRGGGSRGYGGYLVTEPIYINPSQKWDILLLEGTMPKNTTVSISILDGAGKDITGWTELTDWNIDLSLLTGQSPLIVKVKVTSEFNWTTPVLDRLTVKWMAKGYWRDQFYGAAKVERQLNVGVSGGELGRAIGMGAAPQLLVTGLRADTGYTSKPLAFVDGGGLDYLSLPPMVFEARGIAGADVADVNGDGLLDVVFAVNRISDTAYDSPSLLFLGSAVGFRSTPERSFPTVGASDVLLKDLNGDGHLDLVFAQDTDGITPRINSSLYWGLAAGGWATHPDVQFETNGASGVAAADLDGDGRIDLAFSCQRDASTTSTNSMVFMQDANGYCGTTPSYLLPTKGATAVAAGDVNGDGRQDLVFANSFWAGSVEIDSNIYWGKAGGGFETTPGALKTVGAEDVKVADLDGDGDLDVVFANAKNNVPSYRVDSYVYLNGGSGSFPTDPSARLPTTGAVAVAVADLDGAGRKDLVFACQQNGTSFNVKSVAFLGGASAWSSVPDIELPTVGASDVLAVNLISQGTGGYMSKVITPENAAETGAFHTFRYTAGLGAQQAGTVMLVDATTWTVLAETTLQSGTHEWFVKDLFWVKEHPRIRVVATVTGLDMAGTFTLDELYLNWTKRIKDPPKVLDLGASPTSLLRLKTGMLWVNVTDEYDPAKVLRVTLEHRLNGSTTWNTYLFGTPTFSDGSWRVTVLPRADATIGMYDVRVSVIDSDTNTSGYVQFPNVLEVLNNVPTTPVVRIVPEAPLTTTSLRAEMVTPGTDVETGVVYRYKWFKDGELVDVLTEDTVTSAFTSRGENWSVEVRAFDGLDEGTPGFAWATIHNAPPQVAQPLSDPEFPEDTVDDRWIDLGKSFSDPDGDVLTYTLTVAPEHITIAIDPATGKVTLTPDEDWNGQESATFVASDGELTQSQTVLITVTPVNDPPRFTTLNGEPITADPMTFEVIQGGTLIITVGTQDVEGDNLVFSVNTTAVQVDDQTGQITFQPGNDAVGTVRFALTVYDVTSPTVKVKVNIAIKVLNANDPPSEARITNPRTGDKFKANTSFSLLGVCTDPDTPFGQVLNYTWWWNGTHLIGYGSSLTTKFMQPGNYTITLNVTDGEFFREASVAIEITPKEGSLPPPPPPPPPEEEGLGAIAWIGALVALVIIGGVIFLVMARKRAAEKEAADEEEEKRDAFKQMAVAVKETADQMQREVAESKAARAAAPESAELEEIKVEGLGSPAERRGLTVEAHVTEEASKEVQALFASTPGAESTVSSVDADKMRLDGLKRKYQTAISRLPYGIPAPALKDKDWPWLAAALATGEKKTTPDGREATKVEGRWYFSDVKDASSFLTEHGAKAKPQPKRAVPSVAAAPAIGKATLLAKLEERFILGEISEESYKELKKKFESDAGAPKQGSSKDEWVEEG